eukprot:3835912-Prymnesium_polylepis.1
MQLRARRRLHRAQLPQLRVEKLGDPLRDLPVAQPRRQLRLAGVAQASHHVELGARITCEGVEQRARHRGGGFDRVEPRGARPLGTRRVVFFAAVGRAGLLSGSWSSGQRSRRSSASPRKREHFCKEG